MLDRIEGDARVVELLASVFDFDLERRDPVEPVRLASGGALRPVAGDATGGTFFDCGGPVLYASSEGQAGIVAADLTALIRLVVGLPEWHDVASCQGDPDAMRAAFEAAHAEFLEFEPDLERHQADVHRELGLDPVPVDELLAGLNTSLDLSPAYRLLSEDGDEYLPL
ncbi:MAG: hypothetical protein HOV94_05680 [Saccharothrix sp.]|nr:hypothetical protein [Saccharothrix sp.]